MKKYLWTLLALVFFVVPIANIINFTTTKTDDWSKDIGEIVNPSRGWPKKTNEYMYIWEWMYNDTFSKINTINVNFANEYSSFYLDELVKYQDSESKNAGKPGYDDLGIPNDDINKFIAKDITNSHAMQLYMALSLRSYYIEFCINNIKKPNSNQINSNQYLNLWTMKYFNAGFYYQWMKIWIPKLGRTEEVGVDIDFNTFSGLVQYDANHNPLWGKGPNGSAKPLISLDKMMAPMINELYEAIMAKIK